MSDFRKTYGYGFSEWLRRQLCKLNITHAEMCRQINRSHDIFIDYRKKKREPKFTTVINACDVVALHSERDEESVYLECIRAMKKAK